MNFFEAEIAKFERRIKGVRATPDPTKLKSNLLFFELELQRRQAQFQSWKEGKPFAYGNGLQPLFRAMGFEYMDLVQSADKTGPRGDSSRLFDFLRSEGYPDQACDRTVACIPLPLMGEVPRPAFLAAANTACDCSALCQVAVAVHLGVPYFVIDLGFETSDYTLDYVTQQLGEMIEFAEDKVPGVKYDETKLIELQEYDRLGVECARDIYQLKRRVPCPLNGRDAFREHRVPSMYPDPAAALEWLRIKRDEMYKRADEGIGVLPEEKLRLMWTVTGPMHANPFRILEEKGVTVPAYQVGGSARMDGITPTYGDETEYGRKLTPLEEQARMLNCNSWGSNAQRWINACLHVVREQKVGAIVNFLQVGCVQTLGLHKLLADAAEQELGIPTLHIEGRMLESESYNQQEFETKLTDFLDICIARKVRS